jgi:hypothetical protein
LPVTVLLLLRIGIHDVAGGVCINDDRLGIAKTIDLDA